ncbi:putative metalloprotease CJM1_0395 family protein [Aliarcobacter butzleri]|uniref:Metalloprotease CJM1_0395 family protein n=1 Tax=Aliarcobacter butzleri TaxID=28197 RepID=A0AAW7Q9C0_9BACT|nr:putative metalloprotease CJM1_0395 family protein [Aliarcobacter butzleri]MDN5108208.1 putative metalloprotease CJM1_0395 family protein [Aliarcobacter butzleri]MDN5122637.1 putative metalloprotease CJM1_0395 family protein [Aliarcobacter butzleri]
MEISDNASSLSSIYQELALKKSELSNLDKKELQKSSFEKNDEVVLGENYDENDYQRVLNKFKNKDNEVKTHEQTHASGVATTSAINYNYQVGPDGKLYAIGGSVRFDTSIPKDPQSAKVKMDQLQSASSSVSSLSGADASIAQTASLNKMLLESIKEGFNYDNQQ